MINDRSLICLVLLLILTACGQEDEKNYARILDFETSHEAGELTGWTVGRFGKSIHLDEKVVHSGSAAARMERSADAGPGAVILSLSIPINFTGSSIELKGWLKTKDVQGGYGGLWVREVSSDNKVLQFDNMAKKGPKETHDWQEFNIVLPLEEDAERLTVGALLVGTGTVWVDDLRLLVDDRPLAMAPKIALPEDFAYPLALGIGAVVLLFAFFVAARARAKIRGKSKAPLRREPGTGQKVMLFDGVCNLCNASVRWVLDRDHKQQFDFASLQSDAAHERLKQHLSEREIAALPDSIILIDKSGVHTQSTAVLRIAKGLGFPYFFVVVFFVLPRPVRDMVYRWIARNRYRWFGQQETCMLPTPELANRFLDAQEPRDIATKETKVEKSSRLTWIPAFLGRISIVYVLLYILPFPLSTLAKVAPETYNIAAFFQWVIKQFHELWNPMIVWMGETVFDKELLPGASGSGDRTFNYITLAFNSSLAVAVALLWTLATRAKRVSGMTWEIARVLVRYYLATFMLIYGFAKFFPLQFSTPSMARLMQPFGDASPMGLAWTFLGANVGYQMFAGFMELVGGYLLFWRRTRLMGALVSAAVMINVAAINFCFDVPVKLFSSHLILMALFVMAPDFPRLFGLFGFRLPVAAPVETPIWATSRKLGVIVIIVHLLYVGVLTKVHVEDGIKGTESRKKYSGPLPLEGIYRVESFVRDGVKDRDNADADRWVQIGFRPPFITAVIAASGDFKRARVQLDYTESDDGTIRLEGKVRGKPTVIIMRLKEKKPLLTSRGFNWINERPFNR